MRTQASMVLAAIAFALPTFAQTNGQDAAVAKDTEKLWRIECSGIGGWGAASQAARVGSILKKQKQIRHLILDTTGVGYFELRGKKAPEIASLNAALQKGRAGRVRISKLEECDVEKADIVYEVSVAGLGWMATAIETRDVLSKLDNVIRVHPNGLNGKALVFVSNKKKVKSTHIKEALATTAKLRFRKMKRATGI